MPEGAGDAPPPIDAGEADAALRFSLVQQGVAGGGQKPPVPLKVDDAGGDHPSRTYHFTVGSDRKIYGRDDALPDGPSFPMTMTLRTMQGVMAVHSKIFRPDELVPDALRWDGGSSIVHADLPSDQGKGFGSELRNEHRLLQFTPQEGDYLSAIRANIVNLQMKGLLFQFTVPDDAMTTASNTNVNVGTGEGPEIPATTASGAPLTPGAWAPEESDPEVSYDAQASRWVVLLRPRIAVGAMAATVLVGLGIGGYLLLGGGGGSKADNPPAPAEVSVTETAPTAGQPAVRAEGLRELLSGIMEPAEIDAMLQNKAVRQEPAHPLIYSVSGTKPGLDLPQLHITQSFDAGLQVALDSVDPFKSPLSCAAAAGNVRAVCSDPAAKAPAPGAYLLGAMSVGAPIPLSDSAHAYIYSFVLDADGNPANNFQAAPNFNWDYFQNTDLWVQLKWGGPQSPTWSLSVTHVNGQQQDPVNADVRALIGGDSILFMLPKSLVSDPNPGVRFTTFGFNGTSYDAATSGGAVTGGDPTQPLARADGSLPQLTLSANSSTGAGSSSASGVGAAGDAKTQWQQYLDDFVAKLRVRDNEWLFAHLNPAVLQVFGADQCKSSLAGRAPDPTINIQVNGVTGPAPWPYEAAGQSINVDGVYSIDAIGTSHGKSGPSVYHFTHVDGQIGWFTQCTPNGQ